MYDIFLPDTDAMIAFGAQLSAHFLKQPLMIFLQGDLGAGKTTLTRGILRGLGYAGKVKSPTFTLVEPYQIGSLLVYHFDLYRLHDARELLSMGMQDYLSHTAICIIEWPEKAAALLPPPDLVCAMSIVDEGRRLHITAPSLLGKNILSALSS